MRATSFSLANIQYLHGVRDPQFAIYFYNHSFVIIEGSTGPLEHKMRQFNDLDIRAGACRGRVH